MMAGMAALKILQKSTDNFPSDERTSYQKIILEPYGLITTSDFGCVQMWSWQGQLLGQLTEDVILPCDEHSRSMYSHDNTIVMRPEASLLNGESIEYYNLQHVTKGQSTDNANSSLEQKSDIQVS